jgi:predicted nucleotidyltransferase
MMLPSPSVQRFLSAIPAWAQEQPDLHAVYLVGSYARGTARPDSDVDLVLLVDDPGRYLAYTGWTGRFGDVIWLQVEEYGKVTSLRAGYADGREVEYGLAAPDWGDDPADEGTQRVIADGLKVLFRR